MFSAIGRAIKWIGQHFLGMLFLLIAFVVLMPSSTTELKPANLQEIQLAGPIINADAILKEIEEVQKDPKIKGVLLNINSPGGAVPPSIEIAYAIKSLKEHKPVVAYASGIMASGSYYASIYANKIIANPGSIVGSIGVILESANVEELMNTIGVKTQIVKQGTYKEAGTPTREWTPEERAAVEAAAPRMSALADNLQRLGAGSDDPTFQDFAFLAAQYWRAFVMAVPEYQSADNYLSASATYVTNAVLVACEATK